MSDAKTEYAMAVIEIKGRSREDEALAKKVRSSYLELRSYGANWAKVNINEVVAEIAPRGACRNRREKDLLLQFGQDDGRHGGCGRLPAGRASHICEFKEQDSLS